MDPMQIKVEEFDAVTASEQDLKRYFQLKDILQTEIEPDYTPPGWKYRVISIRDQDPNLDIFRWVIRNDTRIIANAALACMNLSHPGYEQNQDIAMCNVEVLPEYRQQGNGRALIKTLIAKLAELDRAVLITGSALDVGLNVAQHYGGKVALEGAENRLNLKNVDWDMVYQWIEDGPSRALGVTLETFTRIPDEIVEEYLKIYTETMNQQPLGEIEFEHRESVESRREHEKRMHKRNLTWLTMISREEDGTISGLTEIVYNPHDPKKIQQILTGVKKEYRGRGLGKWLKAAMLVKINNDYPETQLITTGNADANAPMLAINTRLGFQRFRGNSSIKFSSEDLINQFHPNI